MHQLLSQEPVLLLHRRQACRHVYTQPCLFYWGSDRINGCFATETDDGPYISLLQQQYTLRCWRRHRCSRDVQSSERISVVKEAKHCSVSLQQRSLDAFTGRGQVSTQHLRRHVVDDAREREVDDLRLTVPTTRCNLHPVILVLQEGTSVKGVCSALDRRVKAAGAATRGMAPATAPLAHQQNRGTQSRFHHMRLSHLHNSPLCAGGSLLGCDVVPPKASA